MAQNPAVPFWDDGDTFTGRATAAITGKRFVSISGARIEGHPAVNHAVSSATRKPAGVSGYDAPSGGDVTVYQANQIIPVTASGAITSGAPLYSTADGRATSTNPGSAIIAAYAYDDAADGADCPVKLA